MHKTNAIIIKYFVELWEVIVVVEFQKSKIAKIIESFQDLAVLELFYVDE